MECLSIDLTKGSVSHCTFLSPKQTDTVAGLRKQAAPLPPPRPVRRQKSHASLLSQTPPSQINQPFICFLYLTRPVYCLPVTASSDKTHACQTQTVWHLQINLKNLKKKRILSFFLETSTTDWVNYYPNEFFELVILQYKPG